MSPMVQKKSADDSTISQSAKRFKRCIVHIGTEKTGTKAIQDHLARNRSDLIRSGILYPIPYLDANASHWEFVAAVHASPWEQDLGRAFEIDGPLRQNSFREALTKKLESQFDAHRRANTLLISSEHMQSRLSNVRSIFRFKEYLDEWVDEYRIIVYFRRQDRLALSFLSTRLKSSVQLPHQNLLEAMKSTPSYYEYFTIYDRWRQVFGHDAIKPRLFDPNRWPDNDLLKDFCQACELPAPNGPSRYLNPSFNRAGFQFLTALNSLYPITPGDRSDESRIALVNEIERICAGKYYPISRQQAQDFYSNYEEENAKLHQVAFKDYPYPLFDNDFSDYPEQAEQLEGNYMDAVEIAVQLWQAQERKTVQSPWVLQKISRLLGFKRHD